MCLLCSGLSESSSATALWLLWTSPPTVPGSWLWGCTTAPSISTTCRVKTTGHMSWAAGQDSACVCVYDCVQWCYAALFLMLLRLYSDCHNKHLGPVWQLRWTQQELSFTGEEKAEALFSVSADGRISKWSVFNNGLDCTGTHRQYVSLDLCEMILKTVIKHFLFYKSIYSI